MRNTYLPFLSLTFFVLMGCNQAKIDELTKKSDSLQTVLGVANLKIDSVLQLNTRLQSENAMLRETADFYYQRGVTQINSSKYDEAISDFETIIEKFPSNSLVKDAKNKIREVNATIAQLEREQARAEREAQAKMSAEEKRNAMPLTSYAEILAEPEKYFSSSYEVWGKRVKISGGLFSNSSEDHFQLEDRDKFFDVHFGSAPKDQKKSILVRSHEVPYPRITVWGKVSRYVNTGTIFINADWIED